MRLCFYFAVWGGELGVMSSKRLAIVQIDSYRGIITI